MHRPSPGYISIHLCPYEADIILLFLFFSFLTLHVVVFFSCDNLSKGYNDCFIFSLYFIFSWNYFSKIFHDLLEHLRKSSLALDFLLFERVWLKFYYLLCKALLSFRTAILNFVLMLITLVSVKYSGNHMWAQNWIQACHLQGKNIACCTITLSPDNTHFKKIYLSYFNKEMRKWEKKWFKIVERMSHTYMKVVNLGVILINSFQLPEKYSQVINLISLGAKEIAQH